MSKRIELFLRDLPPEDENVEYKTAAGGVLPKDIWEPYTAFANAEGGTIRFGIGPEGTYKPLSSIDADLLQRNIQSSRESYSYKLDLSISCHNGVVSVFVPQAPAPVRPVYSLARGAKDGARVRVGSSNVKVDEEWMKKFAIAGKGGAEQMPYAVNFEETLDIDSINDFIQRVNRRRDNVYSTYTTEETARKLNIVNREGEITLFGLLAFAKNAELQDIVSPTLTTVVTHYPSTLR